MAGFHWSWRREPSYHSELQELLQLYKDIGDLDITERPKKYGFKFGLSSDGKYKVNIMRCLIDSRLITYKGITICWSKIIPLKVRCFVWHVVLDGIPIAESLRIRGINSANQVCNLCNKGTKTAEHLFLQCEFA